MIQEQEASDERDGSTKPRRTIRTKDTLSRIDVAYDRRRDRTAGADKGHGIDDTEKRKR